MKHGFYGETYKVPGGYSGRVVCYEGGRRLWSESTMIIRCSRGDARRDVDRVLQEKIIAQFEEEAKS